MQLDNAEFELKATRVAALLGYGIMFPSEGRNIANLAHNGKEISLDNASYAARHERIIIHGGMPRGKDGYYPFGCKAATITVSQDKATKQIVKDIERRLLPKYTANLEKAKAAIKKNDDYISGRDEQMRILLKATGIKLSSSNGSTSNAGFVWIGGATFRPGGVDSIEIDRMGYVPTEKAIKIAKILME